MNSGRVRLLGGLLLAVTFAAGMLGGAALNQTLTAGTPDRPADCTRPHAESKGRILDQLDLTAEQRAKVDAILERRRSQTRRFWQHEGAGLRSMVDSTRAEIRNVLTPEQRERYDRLRQEHDARWHEKKGRDGGPPPPPA